MQANWTRPCFLVAIALTFAGLQAGCDDGPVGSGGDDPGPAGATCSDGVRNGDEADVDCGGSCSVCSEGSTCAAALDCSSGVCAAGTCAAPACGDGALNGDETDVDCGGTCAPCSAGSPCMQAADCTSGACEDGLCAAPACDDTLVNGDETDVDCGGLACAPCGNQSNCLLDADCSSGVCEQGAGVCVDPGCTDDRLNAGETDVDCGGPTCAPCGVGGACVAGTDCAELVCDPVALTCASPTCADGAANGTETDVDCGSTCSPCGAGSACAVPADCASGVCTPDGCACAAGYEADAAGSCLDVDECTLGTDDCSADGACTNSAGSFSCACNTGFSGDGVTCTDDDECTLGTDGCSADGACTNSAGSFSCACNAGFSGDGVACTDDDECTLGTDDCSADAACTNSAGSFSCACNAGFSGDGVACTDDDECTLGTDDCSADAACTNSAGSFSCACNAGLSGDGVSCTDDDECTLGTDDCSANAFCTNSAGSFSCACYPGFSGDGVTCTDDDECALGTDTCSADATCTNEAGTYYCYCNAGFSGNGDTCTDDDECAQCGACSANGTCTNTPGSFTCACNDGFSGDGVTCTSAACGGWAGAGATWSAAGKGFSRFTWAEAGVANNGRANAEAFCTSRGGTLARPDSQEEWDRIHANLAEDGSGWWMDGHNNFICGSAYTCAPKAYQYGNMYKPTGTPSLYTGCNCNPFEQGLVLYRYAGAITFDGCQGAGTAVGALGVMDEELSYVNGSITGFICEEACPSSYVLTGTPDPAAVFETIESTYSFANNLLSGIWHRQSNRIVIGHFGSPGYYSFPAETGGFPMLPDTDTGTPYDVLVQVPDTDTVIHTDSDYDPSPYDHIYVGTVDPVTGALGGFAVASYDDGFVGSCQLISSSASEFLCFDGTAVRHYATTAGSSSLTLVQAVPLAGRTFLSDYSYGGTFAWDGLYYYFSMTGHAFENTGYQVFRADGSLQGNYTTSVGGFGSPYFDWSVGRYSVHDGWGTRQGGNLYTWSGGSDGDDTQTYGPASPYHSLP